MKGVAHISFAGCGLILPAYTPYERQLLVEQVEVSTRRHGSVQVDFNGRHWTIRLNRGHRHVCGSCGRRVDDLSYGFDGHILCGQCARRVLH